MYQVQGQLHVVADKDICSFIIWTPKGVSIEEIHRDRKFWKICVVN